jgi:phospholipid/cholesterol/gamma-HCH transport system permease protein
MSTGNLRQAELHLEFDGRESVLRLSGDWIACETGVRSPAEVRGILKDVGAGSMRIDITRIGKWDSALIAFLKMLREFSAENPASAIQIDDTDLPDTARRLLALSAKGRATATEPETPRLSLAARVGETYFDMSSQAAELASLVGETALWGARRAHTRSIDVVQLAREAGASALGIVALVNGLIGAILAFIGALQFHRFAADIYVANLVGIAVVREMAAVGTAIVMAGRTGGAYAAHLATMQGNEEIDALNVLGIRVFDFLVLPRIAALVTMMPLLYLYGCAIGLLGGFVASIATLDFTAALYLEQLRGAVEIKQFGIGLAKSVVFGGLIALAGCHIGLKAGRSAADVGRAATSAVVAGIVGVIAVDAVFAVCTNALGI